MTDANWIFDKAIHLMDEQFERDGSTRTVDTEEYRYRTLSILNVFRHELYPYSDTFEPGKDGKRYICPEIMTFEQAIDLDDAIAQGVMPYGLAAELMKEENPTSASYFLQRYAELKREIGARRMAQWEEIPYTPFC